MPKVMVTSTSRGIDNILDEFNFVEDGREYQVLPKSGSGSKIEAFYKFVNFVCSKQGISAFSYNDLKKYFDIKRIGTLKKPEDTGKKKPPEAEQLSLFDKNANMGVALKVERLAYELQQKGLTKAAEMLKPLAMRFRRGWLGPKCIGFFDDLSNAEIQTEDAIKVLDAYESGVADGSQMALVTGLDSPVCGVVTALAKKHDLLPT